MKMSDLKKLPHVNKVVNSGLQIVHMWHGTKNDFKWYASPKKLEGDKLHVICHSGDKNNHSWEEEWDAEITEGALYDGEYKVREDTDTPARDLSLDMSDI